MDIQTLIKTRTLLNINEHAHSHKFTHTRAAFLDGILSRSTLSFDPIGVFFWPTYWVDPPGFGLFALVKCVQWHTPLMCTYRLYWYKTLGWPIAYWFERAVCILPRLQVDKNSFCKELADWSWRSEMHMEKKSLETLNVRYGQNV